MDIDWITLHDTAVAEFGQRLELVGSWNAPTPDEGWDVSDLVGHVIDGQRAVPFLLAGHRSSEAERRARIAADSAAAVTEEWRRISDDAAAAWRAASPSATVQLSDGKVPASEFLREQVAEITIHSWDLARAIGTDEKLDDALVEAVWSLYAPQQATLAASGVYKSPVAVSDDAPMQRRLLALTGRDDRETLAS